MCVLRVSSLSVSKVFSLDFGYFFVLHFIIFLFKLDLLLILELGIAMFLFV